MLPKELQDLMDAAGLNQTTAAVKLGVNRRTVIRWLKKPKDGGVPISAANALLIRDRIKPTK